MSYESFPSATSTKRACLLSGLTAAALALLGCTEASTPANPFAASAPPGVSNMAATASVAPVGLAPLTLAPVSVAPVAAAPVSAAPVRATLVLPPQPALPQPDTNAAREPEPDLEATEAVLAAEAETQPVLGPRH